jgi:hypothetical protein
MDEDDLLDDGIRAQYHTNRENQMHPAFFPSSPFLVSIVTNKTDTVAKGILLELGTEATMVPSESSMILVCTLTASEIKTLKRIVVEDDPHATIHVLGKGIGPLANNSESDSGALKL